MNYLTAVRDLSFVGKLFTAAGLDLDAMIKTADESALAAHLESVRISAAQTAPAITAETPAVAALITAAVTAKTAELTAAHAPVVAAHQMLSTALATAGVKIAAADAEKGVQASDVQTALKSRISIRAREILSARTGADFIDDEPEAGVPKIDPKLTGRARTEAAFKAQRLASSGGAN